MPLPSHGYKGSKQWRTARNKKRFHTQRLSSGSWIPSAGAITAADPTSNNSKRKKAGKNVGKRRV